MATTLLAAASCDIATSDAIREMRSNDPFVRRLAVVSLRGAPSHDHGRVVDALLRVAVHESSPLRPDITRTLQAIAKQSPGVFVDRFVAQSDLRDRQLIDALEAAGVRAIDPIAAALHADGEFDRVTLAKLLARLGGTDRLAAIARRGPDATATAIAALEPLGESARERLLEFAADLLRNGETSALRLAARHSPTAAWSMLAKNPGTEAVAAIVRGLLDSMAVRDEFAPVAALILGDLAPERQEHVFDALLDESEGAIHATAASVLGVQRQWRSMLVRGVAPRWVALSATADLAAARAVLFELTASDDPEIAARARRTTELVGQ